MPKYGTPFLYDPPSVNVLAGTSGYVLQIAGMGVIVSMNMIFTGSLGVGGIIFKPIIDDVENFIFTLQGMFSDGLDANSNFVYQLSRYDPENKKYIIQSKEIIPYSHDYDIHITNNTADDLGVVTQVLYYLIQ